MHRRPRKRRGSPAGAPLQPRPRTTVRPPIGRLRRSPRPLSRTQPGAIVPRVDQLTQVAGALMILVAFAALQFGRTSASSPTYLVLNLIGSAVLAALALHEEQWGFLLLEGVWALVSAWSLTQVLRERSPAGVQ